MLKLKKWVSHENYLRNRMLFCNGFPPIVRRGLSILYVRSLTQAHSVIFLILFSTFDRAPNHLEIDFPLFQFSSLLDL